MRFSLSPSIGNLAESQQKNEVPEPRKTLVSMKALANIQGMRECEERLKALQGSVAWSQYLTQTLLPCTQVNLGEKLGFINNHLFHNHIIPV